MALAKFHETRSRFAYARSTDLAALRRMPAVGCQFGWRKRRN